MIDAGPAGQPTVMVCITCRATMDLTDGSDADAPRAGSALADATTLAAAAANDISVQRIRCLGNCSRGLSAAIRCENAWTYIFGGLDPARDGPSLIIGARLLAQAADGIMPWRGRPESLKRGLIARIPPVNFREELP
jgi:predicted metal-binding protein